jgi:hypothetical protein
MTALPVIDAGQLMSFAAKAPVVHPSMGHFPRIPHLFSKIVRNASVPPVLERSRDQPFLLPDAFTTFLSRSAPTLDIVKKRITTTFLTTLLFLAIP